MPANPETTQLKFFGTLGGVCYMIKDFSRSLFRNGFRLKETLKHSYEIGYLSFMLISITGFIMGLVLTLQSRPTLAKFGATAMLPSMVSISMIREMGPVITALICAGKIGSRIGAEIASMRVTEQIDALEVSAIPPISYLVVPRVLAITFMLPLLVVFSDFFALVGAFVGYNISEAANWSMYIHDATSSLEVSDVLPATIKTFIFGYFIGIIGCYFGYYSSRGTESVGKAANSAVVVSSFAIFIIDMVVVQITSLIFQGMSEAVMNIEGLQKSFDGHAVLRDISMALQKGENLVVLGKSGSGKSVLIKCIIGLIAPDAGSVRVLEKEISGLEERELNEVRKRVGFLFQSGALYDSMNVEENLTFALKEHKEKLDKKKLKSLVMEALTNVGLEDAGPKMPSDLSGGMRKRIALARTIIMRPEIILYDEPTTGLDTQTSAEISELVLKIQAAYKTSSLIITHDIPCAKITANRILVLHEGSFYREGTFEELANDEDEIVKSFFYKI